MIKKISAAVIALAITACTLTACGKNNNDSKNDSSSTSSSTSSSGDSLAEISDDSTAEKTVEPSLTIDGKKVDTKNYIMCTIDGQDIDFDTFRYYFYSTVGLFQSTYNIDLDTIKAQKDGSETLMKEVINSLKQMVVWNKLAKENKITLTDAEIKENVDDKIQSLKSNYSSEDEYKAALKSAYLTEDTYKNVLKTQALYNKVTEKLFTNDGKYATKKADFKKIINDPTKYAHEIHVMIPYCAMVGLDESAAESYDSMSLSEKLNAKYTAYSKLDSDAQKKAKEKAKKTAEEVLKKAQAGDDFEKLIDEYGWDVQLESSKDGNYLNENSNKVQSIPQELVDGSFALNEGEVSKELTENETYGYFIIKRLPIDMSYVNENMTNLIYAYDTPSISDKIDSIMSKLKVTYCDDWDKITADSIT